MAKLMKASDWAKREFAESSIPTTRTVKAWILKGLIEGKVIDNKTYVYENQQFGIATTVSTTVSDLIALSG